MEPEREAAQEIAWLKRVLEGDFAAIPSPLRWDASWRLAHLLNGYELFGGWETCSALRDCVLQDLATASRTKFTGIELWAALFHCHRVHRLLGYGPTPQEEAELDRLCECMRRRLVACDVGQRIKILTAIAASRTHWEVRNG